MPAIGRICVEQRQHADLLTKGLQPYRHGLRQNAAYRPSDQMEGTAGGESPDPVDIVGRHLVETIGQARGRIEDASLDTINLALGTERPGQASVTPGNASRRMDAENGRPVHGRGARQREDPVQTFAAGLAPNGQIDLRSKASDCRVRKERPEADLARPGLADQPHQPRPGQGMAAEIEEIGSGRFDLGAEHLGKQSGQAALRVGAQHALRWRQGAPLRHGQGAPIELAARRQRPANQLDQNRRDHVLRESPLETLPYGDHVDRRAATDQIPDQALIARRILAHDDHRLRHTGFGQ